ncbi:MAG: sodium:calcium antiporter, partial [Spirochaetales bacterium]
LPEAAVSVFAAAQGNPDLALGNAVGSIICDTGLIIGLAALIAPLPLDKQVTSRQGWLQIAFPLLLVLLSLASIARGGAFPAEGVLPQWAGFVFIGLLIGYIFISIRWARKGTAVIPAEEDEKIDTGRTGLVIFKLVLGIGIIIVSSKVLIPAVEITALRLRIPPSIIAATLVALGTSLPELVTAVTAARKGHGELAIGNIIGADILNVLFVSGVSAAVTLGGLAVPPFFFVFQFPIMLVILVIFRLITLLSKEKISRLSGIVLLVFYAGYVVISYTMKR